MQGVRTFDLSLEGAKGVTLVLIARGCRFESCSSNYKERIGIGMVWTANKVQKLIDKGELYKFYKSKEWLELREKILKENHNECEWCRKQGKISRAEQVHHVQYVKKHPELAMSRHYQYKGVKKKNLIALCHDCHDKAHDRMRYKKQRKPVTEERW